MGVFSNNSGKKLNQVAVQKSTTEEISVISEKTKLKGELETDFMLQIEGILEGDIKGNSVVHITKTGKVIGNITAKSVFVDGEVNGEIVADKVEIGEKGKILANIVSAVFVIQEGGVFEGNKRMKVNLIKEEPKRIENVEKK